MGKPDVTETLKKPEVKKEVKKPEVTEAVIEVKKAEGKEDFKKTVEKPVVKEASEAQGADIVMPEVKKVNVEDLMEVKVAAMLAPTCDVITIGKEEPEVKLEASVPIIEVPVVEERVHVADAVGKDFLSAADVEESDVSCDEEDIGWDSETLAWAMGSDAEMRPKNIRYPQDQVGVNYIAVAIDVATEKLAGYRLIQVGLSAADWLLGAVEEATTAELTPYVASVRRSGRKVRRSGEKQTGAGQWECSLTLRWLWLQLLGLAQFCSYLAGRFSPSTSPASKRCLLQTVTRRQDTCWRILTRQTTTLIWMPTTCLKRRLWTLKRRGWSSAAT